MVKIYSHYAILEILLLYSCTKVYPLCSHTTYTVATSSLKLRYIQTLTTYLCYFNTHLVKTCHTHHTALTDLFVTAPPRPPSPVEAPPPRPPSPDDIMEMAAPLQSILEHCLTGQSIKYRDT